MTKTELEQLKWNRNLKKKRYEWNVRKRNEEVLKGQKQNPF
jgi:hypothetical protein